MFATAAALMLEHLGYETRLVTGFYVNPAHYISTHNEYAVQSEDAHVWLEVNAGHDYWIPLEPTPGFRSPRYTAGWWYQVQQAKWHIAQATGIGAVGCIVVYLLRSRLFDVLSWLSWPMVLLFSDRQRVRWLGWLLDRRLALCGLQRPLGSVPRNHFASGLDLPEQLSQRLRMFLDASDALLFGNRHSLTPEQRNLMAILWKELTVASLRKLRKPHTL
jgi:protein-glutamine gamma-glutamyltransferase